MHWLVSRLALVAMMAGGPVMVSQTMAVADTKCQQTNPITGVCLIWAETPGTPGTPGEPDDGPADTGSGQSCYWDPSKQGSSSSPAGPVDCSTEYGYWSNPYNCYMQYVDPQPPPGDPFWEGVYIETGAVYQCYQPQTDLLINIWLTEPPPNSGLGPTPREVAQIAIEQMNLRAINPRGRRAAAAAARVPDPG